MDNYLLINLFQRFLFFLGREKLRFNSLSLADEDIPDLYWQDR